MKKILSFPLLVSLIVIFDPLNAQIRYGPLIGVNSSDVDTDIPVNAEFSRRVGIGIGWLFDFNLGDFVAVSLQSIYLQKGVKLEVNDVNYGSGRFDVELDYLEIPVFFKIAFGTIKVTHAYLLVGPNIGINLRSNAEVNSQGSSADLDINQVIKSIDFGIGFGLGIHFRIPESNSFVFFEGRYVTGLTNLLEQSTFDFGAGPVQLAGEAKSRDFQFMMGASFLQLFR